MPGTALSQSANQGLSSWIARTMEVRQVMEEKEPSSKVTEKRVHVAAQAPAMLSGRG